MARIPRETPKNVSGAGVSAFERFLRTDHTVCSHGGLSYARTHAPNMHKQTVPFSPSMLGIMDVVPGANDHACQGQVARLRRPLIAQSVF
jgi:hypothetical protein